MNTLNALIYSITLGFPSKPVQVKNEKGIPIGKEDVKLPLFSDNMILYMKNTKKSMKNYRVLSKSNKGYQIQGQHT